MFPVALGRIASNGVSAAKVSPAASTAPAVSRYLNNIGSAPSHKPTF